MKRNWLSTLTNIFYLVPALFGDWFTRIAHIALAITSGRYHWNAHKKKFMGKQWYGTIDWKWQKADISSIYFTFLLIISYLIGGGLLSVLMVILAGLLSLAEFDILKHEQVDPNHTLIGVLALIACFIKFSQNPLFGSIALGCFILAMSAEAILHNDLGHALWHTLTATGKTFLLI